MPPFRSPVAALQRPRRRPSAAPSPPFQRPRRRPPFQRPRRRPSAAPTMPFSGPVATLPRPRRRPFSGQSPPFLRPVAALSAAPSPPFRGRIATQPPSARAAEPPSRRAAEPPSSQAAEHPSRPAAEPLDRRAALQPSRPTAEPPSCRAAEPHRSRGAAACRPARDRPTCLGRAVDFEVWVDDLQLFLQFDRADGLSLFDLTSGASPAPAANAVATVRSQWATRDAAARLAVRRHLPTTERAHFSHYKSAQTLYDGVVARYSSPATAALSRLMLPYLFPDLAAFPIVADLITHLRTSDTRYRAVLPAESVLPPPSCPLLPLLLRPTSFVSSRSMLHLPRAGDAAPASASGARALEGLAGAVEVVVEEVEGVGVVVGVVPGVAAAAAAAAAVEAAEAAVVAEGAEAAEVAEEAEVEEAAEAAAAAAAVVEQVTTLRRGVAQVVVRASSSGVV
ncbi:unnamed protein product [Closterium sp. NIES-64]|nr:unnamed protein product [Closterium sp. NIES-64]